MSPKARLRSWASALLPNALVQQPHVRATPGHQRAAAAAAQLGQALSRPLWGPARGHLPPSASPARRSGNAVSTPCSAGHDQPHQAH